jgi:sugar-specific transcriptional regulator TrmB
MSSICDDKLLTLSQVCAYNAICNINMSNISNKSVIDNLQELGLSPHEAQIYLSVLRHGESPAGVILDDVKLHREQVYRALKRLVDEGYLTSFEKRKRSYFSAVDPKVITHKIKAKLATAEALEPYLQGLASFKPQVITVTEGEDAIRLLNEDMVATLPEDGEYLILGGVGQSWWDVSAKYIDIFRKQFEKKRIKARVIAYEGTKYPKDSSYGQINISVKKLKRTYLFPASTAIYGNKVAITLLDPENIAVITIENEKIANSYRQTFEALWR